MQVTEQQLIETIKKHNIKRFDLRECSICGASVGYEFFSDAVFFNGNCGCSEWSDPRPARISDLVDTFARQKDEYARVLWDKFVKSGEPMLTEADKNTVYNLRNKFKLRLEMWSDEKILEAYKSFATSEDYPDDEKFFNHFEPE